MRNLAAAGAAVPALAFSNAAQADKKYGPQGVSDTEIRIGQTMPYSGPASAYGIEGRAEAAYAPLKKLRIQTFDGEKWTPIRDVTVN